MVCREKGSLRILMVEDVAADVELIRRELKKLDHPIALKVVMEEDELRRELAAFRPSLVLSDFMLPRFDGLRALRIVQEFDPDLPFIIVTGSLNELTAVECMKAGAWDYVIKEKLAKLVPAVEGALNRRKLVLENRRTIQALKESEKRFRTFTEHAPLAIVVYVDGKVDYANAKAAEIVGVDAAELIGRSMLDFIHPDHHAQVKRRYARALNNEKLETVEEQLLLPGNRVIDVEVNAMPIEIAGKRGVMAILNDITRRKQAEAEVRKLSQAVEQSPISVVITDALADIEYVNATFSKITGYAPEEVIGRNPRILQSGQTPPETYEELWSTVTVGKVWSGEFINKKKDGAIFWEKAVVSPMFGANGQISHYLGMKEDVTELHRLEERIRQAQKMEALGNLAGGIAHDLNNILTPIVGYTDMSRDMVPPNSELHDQLNQVILASKRAKELIQQLLSFSRQSAKERKPVDLTTIAREVLKLLRAGVPSTIRIVSKIEPVKERVLADPTEIHQALLNLGTNAAHAMPDGGKLTVGLHTETIDEDAAEKHPDLSPGIYLRLWVEDTGTGIPAEIRDRIFEPYFTTKPKGRGTGFGLAQVHAVVTDCGGAITVYSEPDRGAVFNLYFPTVGRDRSEDTTVVREKPKPGNEKILFVDDESAIARLAVRMLGAFGYRVTSRTDPASALELVRNDPDAFDLVVTDMTMPGMTGDRLAQAILEIRPDMPIVLCTGFSEKIDAEIARKLGIGRFLFKPLTADDLARTVRELLDERGKAPPVH
ncbi:MAG: PAS domain S-box protein [Kiritimatiellaeota bacterium]|nr:PAS domain S-box protein [Kiritimatiellota bacterium]